MKKNSPPWRETGVMGKVIQYRYPDGWKGVPDDADLEHINQQVAKGYVEGELCTADPSDPDGSNILRGWWRLKPKEESPPSRVEALPQDPSRNLVERHVLANVSQLLSLLPEPPEFLTDEVLECWAVSEWLHHRLQQEGQPVGQIGGLHVWGRRTSGQAIRLDDVIREIATGEGGSKNKPTTCDLYRALRDAVDDLDDPPDSETLDERALAGHRDRQLDLLERIARTVDGLLRRQVAMSEIEREVNDAEYLYNATYGEVGEAHDRDGLTAEQAKRYLALPGHFEEIDSLKDCGRT